MFIMRFSSAYFFNDSRPKSIFSISISISFSIAQTPTVRPRAHYIVFISCYSEQYARLKRSVLSFSALFAN